MSRAAAARVLIVLGAAVLAVVGCVSPWQGSQQQAEAASGASSAKVFASFGGAQGEIDPSLPLMIVVDMSTSMDDRDGAGDVKLQKAKEAVDDALRARNATSDTGIWAFPSDDDCSAGSPLLAPGSAVGVADAIANVDKQSTRSGGTPIGAALKAAADLLAAKGYAGANILLITDGLNTCSPDPCVVAKQIVASGFDLHVHGVGFAAERGTEVALGCIAKETDGSVTSVDDGAALDETLSGLSDPALDVRVAAPATSPAAQPLAIGLQIRNPSLRAALDVRATLAFDRDAEHTVRPSVVGSPTSSLGVIPAGATRSFTWQATTDSEAKGLTSSWQIVVSSIGSGSTQRSGEISFTQARLPPTGPLLKPALDKGWPIVVMGDSYSSGEGAGSYDRNPRAAAAACHRSDRTYIADTLKPGQFRVVACSGALIRDLYSDQHDGGTWRARPQLEQLTSLGTTPGAVVLTLGGNDAGFADIVGACARQSSGDLCNDQSVAAQDVLIGVRSRQTELLKAYVDIWHRANSRQFVAARGGAFAPVIVSTYPQVVWPAGRGKCSAYFNVDEVRWANELVDALSVTSQAAVAQARAAGYEIYSTSAPLPAFQPSHTFCDGDRSFVQPILRKYPSQEMMHPKEEGYAAISASLRAWEAAQVRQPPTALRQREAVADTNDWQIGLSDPTIAGRTSVPVSSNSDGSVQPGQDVDFDVDGFGPGLPAAFTLQSTPRGLGLAVADSNGHVVLNARIPSSVQPGQHHLRVSGVDADGRSKVIEMRLTVRPAPPCWVVGLAVLVAFCMLALLLVLLVPRVRRARQRARSGRGSRLAVKAI